MLLDPAIREDCLLEVEAALGMAAPLHERLQRVAFIIGTTLAIQRVVVYGRCKSDDQTVRIRESWAAERLAPLDERIDAIPLVVNDAEGAEVVVTAAPQGVLCPSDCSESLPHCALRGDCSSIIVPVRLGATRYGSLALHTRTGTRWTDQHASLARNVAKRIAIEIASARHEQIGRALDAQRSGIAATVLHQVATPLTIIAGVIDQLIEHSDQPPELLHIAIGEVVKLQRLCSDLAIIAGGVSGLAGGSRAQTDVTAVLRRCAKSANEHRFDVATVALAVGNELPPASCTAADLERVVERIIENSILYANGRVSIDIECWSDEHHIFVRIGDDGIGVTPAQASILGEPFTRLDPNMHTLPGGRGLSLSLGRQFARANGGDLTIEPRTDSSGTYVTIVLPTAPRLGSEIDSARRPS